MRPLQSIWKGCGLLVVLGLGFATEAGASSAPVVVGFERFHRGVADDSSFAEGGLLLIGELNCVACHRLPGAGPVSGRDRLSLRDVGSRLPPESLAAFIAHPGGLKPGTLMPDVPLAPAEVRALAAFLGSLGTPRPDADLIAGSVESGRALYHSVGCIACHGADPTVAHAVTGGAEAPPPASAAVPLALGAQYDRSALVRFLVDPLTVRPAGRMPDSHLTPAEAADIAAYLQREREAPEPAPEPPVAAPLLAEGRRLFAARGCVACHVAEDTDDSMAPAGVSPRGPDLVGSSASFSRGCLANDTAAPAPHFRLDEAQRRAIGAALQRLGADAAFLQAEPRRDVERFMARMNCYACHARDGRGGVEPGRASFFAVTDSGAHSLGEMGNLPPALDHTGRKLTRSWWGKLLWEGGGEVRPYQAARMPAFGREACEPVLDAWEEADRRTPPVAIDVSGRQLHQRAPHGRRLMGTQDGGLGCITCHGLLDRAAIGVSAIPLTHTVERLRPEYFKELLLNPQSVQPGTLMPPMFMGREKADQEIEQLWTYLKEIDQQLLPEGLLRTGEYEIKPEELGRMVVFRTFLDGGGLEAVAVGSPSGRHAAFDAREVRWALTWSGRFLDALTTWEERAMTPARPLGEAVTTLAAWTPFVREAAIPAAVPPAEERVRYRGYALGADGVPTFRYDLGPLRVEDTLRSAPSGGYRRTLQVSGGGPGWLFRGAMPGAVPQPVVFDAAGEARLEEQLP